MLVKNTILALLAVAPAFAAPVTTAPVEKDAVAAPKAAPEATEVAHHASHGKAHKHKNKSGLRIKTKGLNKHANLSSAGPSTGHHSAGLHTGSSLQSPVSPLTSGSGSSLKSFPGTPSDVDTPHSASSSTHLERRTRGSSASAKKAETIRKHTVDPAMAERKVQASRDFAAKKKEAKKAKNTKRGLEYIKLERRTKGSADTGKKREALKKKATKNGVTDFAKAARLARASARLALKKKEAKTRTKRSLHIDTNGLNKRADLASPAQNTTPLSALAALHKAHRSRKAAKAHKHTVAEKLQLNAMLLEAEHLVNGLEGQMAKEPPVFPNLKHANKMRRLNKIKLASPKTPLTPSTHATPTKAT